MDPDMRNVRRHVADGFLPAETEHGLVARRIELQERHPELKPLRPLRPAARGVAALDREDRRAAGRIPRGIERPDLLTGELEHPVRLLQQLLRSEAGVDFHRDKAGDVKLPGGQWRNKTGKMPRVRCPMSIKRHRFEPAALGFGVCQLKIPWSLAIGHW